MYDYMVLSVFYVPSIWLRVSSPCTLLFIIVRQCACSCVLTPNGNLKFLASIQDEHSYEKWLFNGGRNGDMNGIYPLVICYIAMEAMAHLVRWFTDWKWQFSIAMLNCLSGGTLYYIYIFQQHKVKSISILPRVHPFLETNGSHRAFRWGLIWFLRWQRVFLEQGFFGGRSAGLLQSMKGK